jgi:hypothetical protein
MSNSWQKYLRSRSSCLRLPGHFDGYPDHFVEIDYYPADLFNYLFVCLLIQANHGDCMSRPYIGT